VALTKAFFKAVLRLLLRWIFILCPRFSRRFWFLRLLVLSSVTVGNMRTLPSINEPVLLLSLSISAQPTEVVPKSRPNIFFILMIDVAEKTTQFALGVSSHLLKRFSQQVLQVRRISFLVFYSRPEGRHFFLANSPHGAATFSP
jgi:hypothetical protein